MRPLLVSFLCLGIICGCGGSSGTVDRDPRGGGFGAVSLLEGMDWSARWVAVRGLWVPMSGSVLGRYQTSQDEPDWVFSSMRIIQGDLRNFSLKCKTKLVSFERVGDLEIQMGLVIRTNSFQSVVGSGDGLPMDFTGIRCFWASGLSRRKKSFVHRILIHEDEAGRGPLEGWTNQEVSLEGRLPYEQFEGVNVEHEITCHEDNVVYSAVVRFPDAIGIEPQRLGPVRYRVKTIREGGIGLALFSGSPIRRKGLDTTVSYSDLVLTPFGDKSPR